MVEGAASQKIRFWVDETGGHGERNGIQNSLYSSVNDEEEISEEFKGSKADSKRIKLMGSHQEVEAQNVSEKSSPLGLILRKTPSFLDLIEMKLSQGRNQSQSDIDSKKGRAKSEDSSAQPISEKLKASNFRATLLKIGSWERVSIHEGDLVTKCYYAKRKLVWEVLEHGLKSKIEIQWSNISAIRAIFRENETDTLEIELCRAPMFFRESDPQPRKHTLWQTTSDFTGGQAPIYRWHHVQFPGGTLEKHYEKLLQCDNRLLMLSKKPFPTLSSPYFTNLYGYSDFPFSFNGHRPTSLISVMDPCIKENGNNYCKQQYQATPFWAQGLNNDQNLWIKKEEQVGELPLIASTRRDGSLISQHGVHHHQVPYRDKLVNSHPPPNSLFLNEITDHLLNDPFASVCSDEQRILAKVKSMCNLLEASRESMKNTNSSYNLEHVDIDMKCKAYEGQDYKSNNHIMLRNLEQSNRSSDPLCLELLSSLPKQGYDENSLMNLTRCPSSPYFFLDPVMENAGCVNPASKVNQR